MLLETHDRALGAVVEVARPGDGTGHRGVVLVDLRLVLELQEERVGLLQLAQVLLQNVLVALGDLRLNTARRRRAARRRRG